jgi:hypothetical protein
MLKKDALKLIGRGSVVKTAAALELTHPAVSKWPEELPLFIADRVRGAAVRLKMRIPKHMKESVQSTPDTPKGK